MRKKNKNKIKIITYLLFIAGILGIIFFVELTFLKISERKIRPKFIDKIKEEIIGKKPVSDENNSKYYLQLGDKTIYFSIDALLQKYAESILKNYNLPFASIVVVKPLTGELITLASYKRVYGIQGFLNDSNIAYKASYPAASVFKIITASAALEKSEIDEYTSLYCGGSYMVEKGKFINDPVNERHENVNMIDAMARSCNVFFSKLAVKYLSSKNIIGYAEKYGFNHFLNYEIPVDKSSISLEDDKYQIAQTGAGFGNAKLSPIHGAMIASVIANGGNLMLPYFIAKIKQKGKIIYKARPIVLERTVREETAMILKDVMSRTTTDGTARKAFVAKNDRYIFPFRVYGKTGSLNYSDNEDLCTWFVGFTDNGYSDIAICVMVINTQRWIIKASPIASEFLRFYFERQR